MRLARPASPTIPRAAPNKAAVADCSSPVSGSAGAGGVTGGVGGVTGGVGGVTGGVGGVTGGVGGVTGGVGGVTGGVGGITVLLNSVSTGNSDVAVNTLPSFVTLTATMATILSYLTVESVPCTSSTV